MNREIKFRATKQVIGGFAYGHYTQGSDGFHYITKPDGEIHEVNPDTVCQFTGLQDKNGKDIYEGDITFHQKHGKKCKIVWVDIFACFAGETIDDVVKGEYSFYQRIDQPSLEIIGNIFENPELVEQ